MKAIFNIILIVLLSFCFSKLKTQFKPCTALGFDCDASRICCGDYHCVNDRCQIKDEKSTLKYSKELGGRCDTFHKCGKGLRCESHRCTSKDPQDILKMVQAYKNKAIDEVNNIINSLKSQ